MKRTFNPLMTFKGPLLAGLLTLLVTGNAMAQTREDDHWSPLDVYTDDGGNQYAYWDDINNWSLAVVPDVLDTNAANTFFNAAFDSEIVTCLVTNDAQVGQLMCGFGGGGTLVITNGAHFQAGFAFGGNWTGIGFVAGPGTLIVGPSSDFTCASHLWVGQGTANQGTVIINGGTLHIPNGQLGVSWNGIGGTNYITLMNGGKLFMSQWAASTLGEPGNSGAVGIMNIADSSSYVVVTNNQLGYFNTLETNNQLIAYGGAGTINASYNPALNITTINAVPAADGNTPVINAQPANVVASLGGEASFTVGIANPPVTYQWLFNGNPISNGGGISGAQTATLTIGGVTAANIGNYSVMATSTVESGQIASSTGAGLSTTGINLYPVVTILGVPGDTYVTSYSTAIDGTYIPFATNTVGSFAPFYLVDTNTPMSVTRFYKTHQQ